MSGVSRRGLSDGLVYGARRGHPDVVQTLLNEKSDGNAAAAAALGRITTLQAAAEDGHVDVKALLTESAARK